MRCSWAFWEKPITTRECHDIRSWKKQSSLLSSRWTPLFDFTQIKMEEGKVSRPLRVRHTSDHVTWLTHHERTCRMFSCSRVLLVMRRNAARMCNTNKVRQYEASTTYYLRLRLSHFKANIPVISHVLKKRNLRTNEQTKTRHWSCVFALCGIIDDKGLWDPQESILIYRCPCLDGLDVFTSFWPTINPTQPKERTIHYYYFLLLGPRCCEREKKRHGTCIASAVPDLTTTVNDNTTI